jgi:hypothetical protein
MNCGKANLGSLQMYVDEWNISDMTEATLGLGKDGQPAVDTRGPRSTVQHMYRLKRNIASSTTRGTMLTKMCW